jgi:hypothetical protein
MCPERAIAKHACMNFFESGFWAVATGFVGRFGATPGLGLAKTNVRAYD